MDQTNPQFSAVVTIGPEIQTQIAESSALIARVRGYKIDDDQSCQSVNAELIKIKTAARNLDNVRKSIVKPLDEARANAQAFFVPALNTLKMAEDHCKNLILGWNKIIEDRRREAQRKADEENRIARQKLEAEAAAARAKAEELAKEERRKAAEAEAARLKAIEEGNARAAAEAAARAAKAAEKAAAIVESAESKIAHQEQVMPLVMPAIARPTDIKGFSARSIWRARVIDKSALIRAACDRPDLAALLLVDEKAANRLAAALKGALNVPGIEAYEEKIASSRTT